ncbi:glycerate kinase type-2 family protein [Oricola sp.]|uniref:glycerate kinase type-2 family protein n=1 Tax=Oricola sp. TaxID=1979950 RepID=UPI003BAB4F56
MTGALAADALEFFRHGVAAADPHDAVMHALEVHDGEWSGHGKIHLVAAGKAALPMAEAALSFLPATKIASAFAVTNYENVRELPGLSVMGASHPLPDENGATAAKAIEDVAIRAGASDLVLCLISGGASALLPAPADGITLAEKTLANDLLLKSGADIVAMNTVRKVLSRLKGGGLARKIAPAQGLALILSDVPGDDLAIIASGPTVANNTPAARALAIVRSLGLEGAMPETVMAHLKKRAGEPTEEFVQTTENILVGSNRISLHATANSAARGGYETVILSEWLEGDVADAAKAFWKAADTAEAGKPVAILSGGETSVHVTGGGKGGRNQEMALRFAALCRDRPLARDWAFLSGGTDGRDGPTDAAGGLVTPETLGAIEAAGKPVEEFLADNDAYHALYAGDGLVMTGATGTNVADLQVLLLR